MDISKIKIDNSVLDVKDTTARSTLQLLGTASVKDAPASGNASNSQVVLGSDTRLSDPRPASDVYEWAKASAKPTYTKSEVGLGNVTNDSQVKRSEMGVASGVATLDSTGKVPSTQLPSYVDDVIEGYMHNGKFYAESTHDTLITGESGKIYSDLSTSKIYRWGGSAFAVISDTITVGTTQGTAFDGKSGYDHVNNTSNPHSVTKSQVGLGNVGNFKAVSTVASQGLDSTEQSNARANIGLGSLATKSSLEASDIPTITKSKISDFPSSMPASDVSSWAKESTKPSYTKSEVGLGNVGNFKAVSTEASQGLTDTEKSNARANIGAGTSSFSGSYTDLTDKPTIPELPTMPNDNGHDYVEIAGIKWATMNIGATAVTDTGLYFQWGDTQGYTSGQCGTGEGQKYFGWEDYKYGNGTSSPGATGMTKYNSSDGKTVLDSSDDAVTAAWGGSWRMPTTEEFVALGNAVDFIDANGNTITGTDKRTTLSGVTGFYVADKTDHSKRLFFPGAGRCSKGNFNNNNPNACYWSSSLAVNVNFNFAQFAFLLSGYVSWEYNDHRNYGFPVRGVLDDSITPSVNTSLHKVAVTGDYNDLNNKPTIPDAQIQSDWNLTNTSSKDYIKNKPSSMPASDVSAWAKASAKPTYIANEVMSISSQSISANTSSSCGITGSSNAGKAQTIIYVNSGSSNVIVTVPTTYRTPNGVAIELICPVGGYCEVSYLNIGGTIYARGL